RIPRQRSGRPRRWVPALLTVRLASSKKPISSCTTSEPRREAADVAVPHHLIRCGAQDLDDPAKLVALRRAPCHHRPRTGPPPPGPPGTRDPPTGCSLGRRERGPWAAGARSRRAAGAVVAPLLQWATESDGYEATFLWFGLGQGAVLFIIGLLLSHPDANAV